MCTAFECRIVRKRTSTLLHPNDLTDFLKMWEIRRLRPGFRYLGYFVQCSDWVKLLAPQTDTQVDNSSVIILIALIMNEPALSADRFQCH
jgi:hypothetical protein